MKNRLIFLKSLYEAKSQLCQNKNAINGENISKK